MNEGDLFGVPIYYGPADPGGGPGGMRTDPPRKLGERVIVGGGSFPKKNSVTGEWTNVLDSELRDVENEMGQKEKISSWDISTPLGKIVAVLRELDLHRDPQKTFQSSSDLLDAIQQRIKAAEESKKKATDKGKRDADNAIARYKAVEGTYLRQLREALDRWLPPEYSPNLTLEGVYKAFRSVEVGERAPIMLAPEIIKKTTLTDPKSKATAMKALDRTDRFREAVVEGLGHVKLSDIELGKKDAREITFVHHKILDDIAEILHNRDLFSEEYRKAEKEIDATSDEDLVRKYREDLARERRATGAEVGIKTDEAAELKGELSASEIRELRDLKKREALRALVWGAQPPPIEVLVGMRNYAYARATGTGARSEYAEGGVRVLQGSGPLTEMMNQALRKLHPKEGSGSSGSAMDVFLQNYKDFELMPSMPARAREQRQEYYRERFLTGQRGTTVLDATFPTNPRPVLDAAGHPAISPRTGRPRLQFDYKSIGHPLSWLVAATHPDYLVAGETKEEQAEVIKREIENLKETIKQFAAWFAERHGIPFDKIDPLHIEARLLKNITPEFIEEVAKAVIKAARDGAKKEDVVHEFDLVGGPEAPDEFARIQKIFTDKFFVMLKSDDRKTPEGAIIGGGVTLPQYMREASTKLGKIPLEHIYTTGLWRSEGDKSVESLLRSHDLKSDVGTKRSHVEQFVEHLARIAETVKEMDEFKGREERQYEIINAAKAIREMFLETRVGRVTDDRESAKMYENFATAFRVLVGYDILQPLSGSFEYPAQEEGEDDGAYQKRINVLLDEHNQKKENRKQEFMQKRDRAVVHNLEDILKRIEGDKTGRLLENFLPQLVEILNEKTGTFLPKVKTRMHEIKNRPPISPITIAFEDTIARKLDYTIRSGPTGRVNIEKLREEWREFYNDQKKWISAYGQPLDDALKQDAEDYFDAAVTKWREALTPGEHEYYEKLHTYIENLDGRIEEFAQGVRGLGIKIGYTPYLPDGASPDAAAYDPTALHSAFLEQEAALKKLITVISSNLESVEKALKKEDFENRKIKDDSDAPPQVRLGSGIYDRYKSIEKRFLYLRKEYQATALFFAAKLAWADQKHHKDELKRLEESGGSTSERAVEEAHIASLEEINASFDEAKVKATERDVEEAKLRDLTTALDAAEKGIDPDATPETPGSLRIAITETAKRVATLTREEAKARAKALEGYGIEEKDYTVRTAKVLGTVEEEANALRVEALDLNEKIDTINDEIDAATDAIRDAKNAKDENAEAAAREREQAALIREKTARDKLDDVLRRLEPLEK